ncbi:GntR family transcriptional regulator [Minwuia thermotolerans]|uniref:GntR family transcriptional regulator n=1 Tax=Minwuia thermotolerans TaxID=2056226 RepID=UPI000D6DC4B3|nr:GntR family transcriptional regulator [Minwuia thermotolerans]
MADTNRSSFKLERAGPRTLAESIAATLRDRILARDVAPGEPLLQGRLATEFSVSQAPVRDALRVLAAEGLVTLESHRRAVVSRMSPDELDEMYCIVASLEQSAARRVVPTLDAGTLADMRRNFSVMAENKHDPIVWYRANEAFHRALLAASGWSRMLEICDHCRGNIGRYVTNPAIFFDYVARWTQRNGALLEACERGDADAAVAALATMHTISISEIRENMVTQSIPRREAV